MSVGSGTLIWVHEEALRDDHPAYQRAPDGTRRIFIWDANDFEARAYSLKRLVFIHECLQDMKVEVIAGDTEAVLKSFPSQRVITAATPDPARRALISRISDHHVIDELADDPLASIPSNTDMGRFFRFWNRARKSVMSLSSEQAAPFRAVSSSPSDATKTSV